MKLVFCEYLAKGVKLDVLEPESNAKRIEEMKLDDTRSIAEVEANKRMHPQIVIHPAGPTRGS